MCPVKICLNEAVRLNEITSYEIKLASSKEEDLKVCKKDKETDVTGVTLSQCVVCKFQYENRDEQVEHYKSEYHLHNYRLRMRNKIPLAMSEFEEIEGKTSESDMYETKIGFSDSLYLSSSESEGQVVKADKQFSNRLPKFYFSNEKGECFSFYKKLLYNKKNSQIQNEIISLSRDLLTSAHCQTWAVILFNGEHFAAAVFEGNRPAVHKSIDFNYVAKPKNGQSTSDKKERRKKQKAKSADLRRNNEAKKAADIYELLSGWKEKYLDKCNLVFMKIPPYKMGIFTGGKNPIFAKKDSRIRQVPFRTKKPSFNEIVRIHTELYSITWYDKEAALNIFKQSGKKEKKFEKNNKSYQKSLSHGKNVRKRKEKKKQEMYSTPSTNDILQKGRDCHFNIFNLDKAR